jgi:hypothetical protein
VRCFKPAGEGEDAHAILAPLLSINSPMRPCTEPDNAQTQRREYRDIDHCINHVTHGLVLLFGIGTRVLPSWDSKTRWINLSDGLADRVGEGCQHRRVSKSQGVKIPSCLAAGLCHP